MNSQNSMRPIQCMVFLLLVVSKSMLSQEQTEFPMSNSELTECVGVLLDSGGTYEDYGDDEDITMTICPEAPETIVNLYFVISDLAPGDFLEIFDGPAEPANSFGVFTGGELLALDFFASEANISGCLTLHFTSNASGSGNFAAAMTCGYPCEKPFAVVDSSEPIPHLACPGEEITFDASSSTVADNFAIDSWEWDFDDGTESTSGPLVTHSFDLPGAYKVQLMLTDDNVSDENPDGCENANLIDHLVLISTDPDWTGTSQDATICQGQQFPLSGVVEGVTYDSEPSGDFGEGLFIPDVQGNCFSTTLTLTSFAPGAVVEDASTDIESVFVNMEHSYMGDLTIQLICPNGSVMQLQSQGGGGTYLGEPVDMDNLPDDPGVGYDYFWSPVATNGTWTEESFAFGTLPSGIYSAVGSWTSLEGCPLNGTWEIEICDILGSDNGFIFEWAINFNPELYPEPIVFTPVFGMGCDSTSWEGPNIYDENEDCNEITLVAVESGTYTYTATNNFGCTFSTDVDITVVQGPEIEIETPAGFCGSPVSLVGNVLNQEPGFNYSYEWSPADLVNGNGANVNVDGLTQDTVMTLLVTVTGGDLDNCEVAQNVEVDFIPPPNGVNASAEVCPDDAVQLVSLNFANEGLSESDFTYDWQFEGETVGTGAVLNAGEPGEYEVLITMAPPCTWTTTSFFDVEEDICELTIPNVISPNGPGQWDALNDAFYVEGLDSDRYNGSTIRIYNRWGQLMYTSNNFGKSSGWKPVPDEAAEGTYYYVLGIARTDSDLIINDVNGQTIDEGEGFKYINGAFTLVR